MDKNYILDELLLTAKSIQNNQNNRSIQSREEPVDKGIDSETKQVSVKRGRWDDGSDSDEEKKRRKKEKKTHKQQTKQLVAEELPEVTVSLPGAGDIDDYYRSHPLMELPPESPSYSQENEVVIQDCILPCRNVNIYEKLARLNEGSYGVVYKARNTQTGEIVALKRIKFNENVILQEAFPVTALREINILQDLHHPNILNVQEMVIGSSFSEVYMVMDYIPVELGKAIHSLQTDLSASEVKTLLYQLLSGIEYMHSKWYFHRDLKSSNLLYKQGNLKICDFGMARRFGYPLGQYTQHVVTLIYRAPELLLNPQEDMRYPPTRSIEYDEKVDMWSVGCLFYEFITRETIIQCKEGDCEYDVLVKLFKILGFPGNDFPLIKESPYASSFNHCSQYYCKLREIIPPAPLIGVRYLSNNGMDLLLKLLEFDPKKRISAKEALNHPYFKENPMMKNPSEMPTFENE